MKSDLAGWNESYEAGLDMLDKLNLIAKNDQEKLRNSLAAALTVITPATYAMGPTEKAADGMIKFAHKLARQHWKDEIRKHGYSLPRN